MMVHQHSCWSVGRGPGWLPPSAGVDLGVGRAAGSAFPSSLSVAVLWALILRQSCRLGCRLSQGVGRHGPTSKRQPSPPSPPPAPSLLSRSCSLSRGLRRAGPNDPPNAPDSRSIHACLRIQQGRPLCKAQSSKPHAQKRKRLRAPWHLLGYSESTQALFSTNGSVS